MYTITTLPQQKRRKTWLAGNMSHFDWRLCEVSAIQLAGSEKKRCEAPAVQEKHNYIP